ncbi:Rrf2 family transcriptional regulator [Rhodopila sp.]|uniref:Rrf2 family transcriptional regulator n=1 Tax=Rhodopila sp. TaxID=2480087 RepID=UPI003D0CF637
MRLTTFSDHTVRTLIYLALSPGRFVSIAEIAGACGMSHNHLMKVVQHLAATGDVTTLRGPHGGVRLARPPGDIRLGSVVRGSERICVPDSRTTWAEVTARALAAFMAVLDDCSLADLLAGDPDAVRQAVQGNRTDAKTSPS